MENQKKKKVSILMYPEMEERLDALFPLHGFSSRSELVCKAVEFYTGFLETETCKEYINQTTLAFLEDQLAGLEAKICRQLFRMCVEMSMASHVFATASCGIDHERMASLRKRCLKDVKNTIGNIRFDKIYDTEHNRFYAEEGFDETEY